MQDYDWLIIGGGPHGAFIADAIRRADPAAGLALVDPEPPLAQWQRRAAACGMQYLRSSNSHHLGARADSLRRFAQRAGYDIPTHSLGYYRRPSLALFEAHAADALYAPPRLACRAERLVPVDDDWQAYLADGRVVTAQRVVVATGPGAPYRPPGLASAAHVFDANFTLPSSPARLAIVGGGITGAQLALRAVAEGHMVCWVTREAPRASDFDSDPCYAGPRCLVPFAAESQTEQSRQLVAARRPGTLPPDIHAQITAALAAGELAWRRGEAIESVDAGLILADGRLIAAEHVILATGFTPVPAADSLLGRLVAEQQLASDGAGHLTVNAALEARPGLHITGRAASFTLGPMAGNIKGARLAGRLLAGVAAARAPAMS